MKTKGIALSGGGIKSYAQLPILKAFQEEGIVFDVVSGTSMGSAIAAIYALGMDVNKMIELALEIEARLVKTRLFIKPSPKILPFSKEKIHGGYVDGFVIEDIFKEVLGDIHLRDVKIPLAIPSVDLITGKIIVFVSHPEQFTSNPEWVVISDISLAKAVRASCSFPLVIAGCELDDYLLADGGIKMNLPSLLLKAYNVDHISAVTMTSAANFEAIDSLSAISNRIYDLTVDSYNQLMLDHIDLMLNVPLGDLWVFEFGKGSEIIDKGVSIAEANREEIRSLREKKRRVFNFFRK
ncbi:MAG TPA: patatin-like phospholipase family protein [Erysipelothrix sp.]|nr:patatin-like phospholipase family protein [Erysipelothrix sp.]